MNRWIRDYGLIAFVALVLLVWCAAVFINAPTWKVELFDWFKIPLRDATIGDAVIFLAIVMFFRR